MEAMREQQHSAATFKVRSCSARDQEPMGEGCDEEDDEYDDEDEELEYCEEAEEDEDFMRLDTIEEEEEESWASREASAPGGGESAQSAGLNQQQSAARPQAELLSALDDSHGDSSSSRAKSNKCDTTTMAATTDGSAQSAIESTSSARKMLDDDDDQAAKTEREAKRQRMDLMSQQPLPSTNRLISEHQARQQQSLFRALAERQKLLDELGAGAERPLDLMSSAAMQLISQRHHRSSQEGNGRRQRRRHRSRSGKLALESETPTAADEGVPLSAVDLSSMSDRMLEELVGQISSASSSQSTDSSCSSLLDSSDLSDSSSSCSSGAHLNDYQRRRHHHHHTRRHQRTRASELNDTPNVVGIHEDERQHQHQQRRNKCREAHKANCDSNQDDDQGDDDQSGRHRRRQDELLVQVAPQPAPGDSSLSPSSAQECSQRRGSKLEQYFASGLVNPHQLGSSTDDDQDDQDDQLDSHSTGQQPEPAPGEEESVEEVVAGMLGALDEASATMDEMGPDQQERLNELLERGFGQLEQLLNSSQTARSQQASQQQVAQKLISNGTPQSSTMMSKDSDYGSDSQSGDCFSSNCTEASQQQLAAAGSSARQQLAAASESPSSLLTTTSGSSGRAQQAAGSALSPLAVELSRKLAESLRRLAQQQAARKAQQQVSPVQSRAEPMKSVVMLNASKSPLGSQIVLCQQQQRNMTPEGEDQLARQLPPAGKQKRQFKTCVNIGPSKVSNVIVSDRPSESPTKVECDRVGRPEGGGEEEEEEEEKASKDLSDAKTASAKTVSPQAAGELSRRQVRRRSSRSSLRRLSEPPGPKEPRPGSPLPRPLLAERAPQMCEATGDVDGELASERQRQKQLQRALILAQKYNYSPAKLAASKLSGLLLEPPSAKPTAGVQLGPPVRNSGRAQLDVSYFAKSGSLTVHVMQCSQLAPVAKRRTTSNPYVKLYLLPDKSKSGKRKSAAQRGQLSPKFDQKFTFGPLQLAQFGERTLWLSVWHKSSNALAGRQNEFLAELYLPMSEIRDQLLSSDLCQSTGPRWYQLNERRLSGRQQVSGRPAKPIQADDLVDRLNELHLRAAKLSTTVAPPCAFDPAQTLLAGQTNGSQQSPGAHNITGQLFVALKFVTEAQTGPPAGAWPPQTTGELHVIIKEAHHIAGFELPSSLVAAALASEGKQPSRLDQKPPSSLPNPFCKCYLLAANGRRLAKQKTVHLKRTANPKWDHKCVFGPLSLGQLHSQAIEIQMFNRDSILVSTNKEFLGAIRLCSSQAASVEQTDSTSLGEQPDSATLSRAGAQAQLCEPGAHCSEREARLWHQMLAKPNLWVYGELRLRPLGRGDKESSAS